MTRPWFARAGLGPAGELARRGYGAPAKPGADKTTSAPSSVSSLAGSPLATAGLPARWTEARSNPLARAGLGPSSTPRAGLGPLPPELAHKGLEHFRPPPDPFWRRGIGVTRPVAGFDMPEELRRQLEPIPAGQNPIARLGLGPHPNSRAGMIMEMKVKVAAVDDSPQGEKKSCGCGGGGCGCGCGCSGCSKSDAHHPWAKRGLRALTPQEASRGLGPMPEWMARPLPTSAHLPSAAARDRAARSARVRRPSRAVPEARARVSGVGSGDRTEAEHGAATDGRDLGSLR
jgi:hypothetical protein